MSYGDGDGDGYGYGFASGDGYGDGDGYGEKLCEIDDRDVEIFRPWKIVKIGCQTHTADHWRKNWKTIASEHGVEIDEEEAERVLSLLP